MAWWKLAKEQVGPEGFNRKPQHRRMGGSFYIQLQRLREREKRFPRRKGHVREGGPWRQYWPGSHTFTARLGALPPAAPVAAAKDASVQGREEPRTLWRRPERSTSDIATCPGTEQEQTGRSPSVVNTPDGGRVLGQTPFPLTTSTLRNCGQPALGRWGSGSQDGWATKPRSPEQWARRT